MGIEKPSGVFGASAYCYSEAIWVLPEFLGILGIEKSSGVLGLQLNLKQFGPSGVFGAASASALV